VCSSWDARIARARTLAETHETAAGLLAFYADLAEQQRELASDWQIHMTAVEHAWPETSGPQRSQEFTSRDAELAVEVVPALLGWLGCEAPPGLVDATAALTRLDEADWRAAVEGYMAGRGEVRDPELAPVTFVVEAVLQPLAGLITSRIEGTGGPGAAVSTDCPRCGSLPVVAVLREEGHGAKRHLVCGLCLHEWPYVRLACPSCGEREFEKLPVYTAEQWPAARIEACDTCRTYIKALDATRDGLIVPVVDDLATVALDLWAREQGYKRLRPSLLGT
jgi:FdhE protein